MKKVLLFSVIALWGFAAFGQNNAKHDPPDDNVPKFEVPVGFSFVNVHPNLAPITSFNVFGGGGQFDVNFGNYFGIASSPFR